jgi:DNA excision repair protein ERCC-3
MTDSAADRPLIVQGDHSVLLEADHPRAAEARDRLLAFAELVKSPEHVHTYRVTPLSVWHARAAGLAGEAIVAALAELSRFPVPANVAAEIRDWSSRYGRLRLLRGEGGDLRLEADEPDLLAGLYRRPGVGPLLRDRDGAHAARADAAERGRLKLALVQAGYPVEDLAGYGAGEPLPIALRSETRAGLPFAVRDYQRRAAQAFWAGGTEAGGAGIVVLPCGAGKTIVGLAAMALHQTSTLILTTGTTASRQWLAELLDKTTLEEHQVGEYSGTVKDVRPVTVASYQILTRRPRKDAPFAHLELFARRDWGLIVYDEVHVLPAPVFQITAGLQAHRRLGLTATLVREDGREDDVFALIGPKRADVPWKEMEREGWIATAVCTEVRVPLAAAERREYALAEAREQFRLASENPAKVALVARLLELHRGEPALVIGMYVEQMERLAEALGLPLLKGSTVQRRRDALYADFRAGRVPVLAVTKIANYALDLPDAAVAIQVSGTFGSRQEEAQRLGRILRPKAGANQAHFYTLVSADTVEQDFALRRQLFLCEQGYEYAIRDAAELELEPAPAGNAAR